MDTKLFQEKSLAKLKKPEGDDKLFRVVPSLGWVGLATVMIVIFSILIWSFFGIMADKVAGYGIILDKEGINSVSTMASGRIVQQNYSLGDRVQEGDILAYIEQGKEEQQLMYQLEVAADSTSQSEMKRQVAELSSMKKGRNTDGQLRSPYTGVVVNVRADEGDVVSVGTPIFDIRRDDDFSNLIAMVYVSSFDGARIKPGTIMELNPYRDEETERGELLGKVVRVSQVPVGSDRINYWTGNKEFASMVVNKLGGSAVEVKVELIDDDESKSGYLWNNVLGGDEEVQVGMVCSASAVVKREAPVLKAFAKLSQWVRSD